MVLDHFLARAPLVFFERTLQLFQMSGSWPLLLQWALSIYDRLFAQAAVAILFVATARLLALFYSDPSFILLKGPKGTWRLPGKTRACSRSPVACFPGFLTT